MRTDILDPLLAPGLDVVLVGTQPGRESLRSGHYYADPTNSFYRDLFLAGFTPKQLPPERFRALLDHGIGLDDVCGDPDGLRLRLEANRPIAVCFNSKDALRRSAGEIVGDWRGAAASQHARFADVRIVWAVSDSSGRAAGHRLARIDLLKQLRRELLRDEPDA